MRSEPSAAEGMSGSPAEGGSCATFYMAVPLLSGMEPREVHLALSRAAGRAMTGGRHVRYLNGMYVPAQARLLCVFVAEDEQAVYAAARLARLPFGRLDVTPLPTSAGLPVD